MRRFLILILTTILIILAFVTVKNGLSIGKFRILSWQELVNNNNDLDDKISNLERLSSVNYPQEQSKLNESYKQLLMKKEEYADLVLYSSENDLAEASQTEIYETEFLWTKIGNYATKNNGIDMKIDVVKGSSGNNKEYNLNFTLVGEYHYISDFISSVENDAKLGFRINNFLLVPATNSNSSDTNKNNSNLLQATFTVENVGININSNTNTNKTDNAESNNKEEVANKNKTANDKEGSNT